MTNIDLKYPRHMQSRSAMLKHQRNVNRREAIHTKARMRRNKLLFYSLEDDEKENAEQSELKIKKFIKEKLKVEPKSIQRAHRVGSMQAKPANGAKNRPRPIIVLFSDFKEKESIRAKRIELIKPFGIVENLIFYKNCLGSSLLGLAGLAWLGWKPGSWRRAGSSISRDQ